PVLVPAEAMLGADGAGRDIVLSTVLPWLLELRAAAGTRRPPVLAPALDPGLDPALESGGARRPAGSLAAS
ncbi:acyl-CoA dehydrogenase, partial [Streptomyces sp. RP5T]